MFFLNIYTPFTYPITHTFLLWYDDDEMETWTFIVQRSDDDVTEVNSEWDYLTGLHGTLPIRACIPVSPGRSPYSTCWPCSLILPLKSVVIAPDDTPIAVEWMNCDLWKGLPIEPVTTHPGCGSVMGFVQTTSQSIDCRANHYTTGTGNWPLNCSINYT